MEKKELAKDEIKEVSGGCGGSGGTCPSCGGSKVVTAVDEAQGISHQYCMECGYEWNFNLLQFSHVQLSADFSAPWALKSALLFCLIENREAAARSSPGFNFLTV